MGDAEGDLDGVVFLDSYARAYGVDLSGTLTRTAQDTPLHAALDASFSTNSAALGPLAVSITTQRGLHSSAGSRLQQMQLSEEQARTARALAATAVGRLSSKTAVAFGFSEGGRALQQRLSQQQGDAFLVARDPLSPSGFQTRTGVSMALRHDFGPLAVTMTTEGGEVYGSSPGPHTGRSAYRTTALVADRRLGPVTFSVGGSLLDEQATILGGRFSSAFSSAGSKSWFADGAALLDLGSGWNAYASYRHGWTSMRGSDALVEDGELSSNAFAFDLAKTSAFMTGDKLALRIMQPLRVRSGGLDINLPVSYDYASGSVGYDRRLLNLAPAGREINYEISYGTRLLGGSIAGNAFVRTDPGHIEWLKSDVGAALRFTLDF